MVCCWISSSRIRKLLRFRTLALIFFITCSVVFLIQSGSISFQTWRKPNRNDSPFQNVASSGRGSDGSGSASGSGVRKSNKLKHFQETLPPREEESPKRHNPEKEAKVLDPITEHVKPIVKHKSYLEILGETNPSHSLDKDKTHNAFKLKKLAQSMNKQQLIFNKDEFPNRPKDGVVIVIQVHKRLEYLAHLLSSLENAKGIENVLLIISSDWYSDALMDAVKKVNFCQVLHIFFPFAEQLHPDTYPGTDPNDCARDLSMEQAKKKKCNNADHPDKYGHYREAKFTMTKHHWWWKANAVFDKLEATRKSNGPVVFLEEDHYVAPDFIHSLNLLHKIKQSDKRCQGSCDILNLGMYVKAENYYSLGKNQLTLTVWRSYDHNMGMTMYRDAWERIKKCAKVFCTFDDYNWDWTLMFMSLNCLDRPLRVLSMDLPRLFHIGECGMHHSGDCNTQQIVDTYKRLIEDNKDALFVKELELSNIGDGSAHAGVQNGGWGDTRDHALCESFVRKDTKVVL